MDDGLFSPISNSFRTTLNSLSKSDCKIAEVTILSASISNAHFKFSSVAGRIS